MIRRQPVTSLSLNLSSSLLLAGTAGGIINVYDVASHQLLRMISTHKGLSISLVATMLKPPDLVGHASLRLDMGKMADAKEMIPVKPVSAFQRIRDSKARAAHEVTMILKPGSQVSSSSLYMASEKK